MRVNKATLAPPASRPCAFHAEMQQTFGATNTQHLVIRRNRGQFDEGIGGELEILSRDELYELQGLIEEILANTSP